jgi:D-3-phosphoglycerate dehydrogenase
MASCFGLTLMAHDPFQSAEAIEAEGVEPAVDLMAALARADFVTVHAPKTKGGPLLGSAELARMKPSAILINTARGGIIDEAALTVALREGRIAGAGLDVFEAEPPSPNHALLTDQRVVLTPHSAGLTQECAARMAFAAAKNVIDFFDGRLDPSLNVDRDVLANRAAGTF